MPSDFFNEPAKDLSELELLIDGEAAFGKVLSAIDATRNSIYIQTYIWKDDQIGRHMVKKLKAAADRGVVVTIRKDVLGTVFELGDMLNGKPSPVFTSAGLKGHKNINVDNDIFADTDHSKYFIMDRQVVIFGGVPDRRRHIAAVGSANLTPRSMLTSKELTVFVHGAKKMIRLFQNFAVSSQRISASVSGY